MSNIVPSKPNFTFGYWRPWKKDANAIDSWLDYTKDTQLAKYTADTVGSYISEASQEQIGAINSLADHIGFLNYDLNRGFEGISSLLISTNEELSKINDSLSTINQELLFINENLQVLQDIQRVGNVLLGNIALLLRVPDSEKQRQHHIELGCKFYTNTVKDDDLFNDSLNEFLAAEKLMPQDYFVLHRIGMIYMFSKKNMNIQLALEYFLRAAKYASVESDTDAARLANILTQNSYSQDEEDAEDLYENTSIYTDEELIGQLAAESYEKAALACYVLGDFEQAVTNAQKAKHLNPEPKYGFKLSKYLARAGKSELAVTALNEAIEKLPKLFIGTYNDLDLLNESRILKLLKDKNEEKTNIIIELISFLKTTNTKEDAYYIAKLKEVLNDNYENKVALIKEVNFVNDTKVKLSAETEKLLNELKTTNKTKYKNYINNLEQAFSYNNYQNESLIKFIQICLKKEEKIDNELNNLSQNIANQHKNLLIINDDFKILIESDLFSKTSFLKKWEKGILQQNENFKNQILQKNLDLKNEISKLNEDLQNQIEKNQIKKNDLIKEEKSYNETLANSILIALLGVIIGIGVVFFLYIFLIFDTNTRFHILYFVIVLPIVLSILYFKIKVSHTKYDANKNIIDQKETDKNIESLKSKFKTFKPIENTSKSGNLINLFSFNISKYTHWLSTIMNIENVNFNENDLLRFIINDKIYIINRLIGTNSFEQTIDERDELFEQAALLFIKLKDASSSILQRKLNIGYNRARLIIDQLEYAGIIGSFNGSNTREVLIASEHELDEFLNKELDF